MKVEVSVAAQDYHELFESLSGALEVPYSENTLDDAAVLRSVLPFEVYFRTALRVKLPVRITILEERQMRVRWHVNTLSLALIAATASGLVSAIFFLVHGPVAGLSSFGFLFLLIYLRMCWQVRKRILRFTRKYYS